MSAVSCKQRRPKRSRRQLSPRHCSVRWRRYRAKERLRAREAVAFLRGQGASLVQDLRDESVEQVPHGAAEMGGTGLSD